MFIYDGQLYAVGVGDFIAYKGDQFAAQGKVNTETMFEFSASNLDLRGGKRAPLLLRYSHSSEATFSIISAAFNPDLWRSTSGGDERSYALVPAEETVVMQTRTLTLSKTPVAVGTIPSKVWVKYNGMMIGAIAATTNTLTIPSDGQFAGIPDNATVCVIYNYKNINASAITIPAEIQPDIWHIFIDVDLATDKSGAGIVGRTVIEIPLGQLDPAQTFNATIDGYTESKITGIMLADRTGAGCNNKGVYAYINTEIFNQQWSDSVYAIVNDLDNVELSQNGQYTISLLGLQPMGRYISLDKDYFGDLTFTFDAGTATGTTFDQTTGVIKAGTTNGQATLKVKVTNKPTIPEYTLEIDVSGGE